jgi:hypothetical protein
VIAAATIYLLLSRSIYISEEKIQGPALGAQKSSDEKLAGGVVSPVASSDSV